MSHPVLKHRMTTLERADKFISSTYFTDVNLRGRIYPKSEALTSIGHFAASGRFCHDEAINAVFQPVKIGDSFGPTWSTHWFRLLVDIPEQWLNEEVHLIWDSKSEAMVWIDGKPIQAMSSTFERNHYPITYNLTTEKLKHTIYVEMACNEIFGAGKDGMINPVDFNKTYALSKAEIAVFDREAYNLLLDIQTLYDMAKHLPEKSERGYQALYTVNAMINECDITNRATYQRATYQKLSSESDEYNRVTYPRWLEQAKGSCEVGNRAAYQSAREIGAKFLTKKNGESQHTIHAMGNCHIDTAWLWPYEETIRKCGRSWSNTIRLMEIYPDFKFACSQAQQFEYVKNHYPSLYKDIQQYVKKERFIPVGGTWVEMDGNIPSGEAFLRQFLYGQNYFQKEFGITCKEFWLPDTFGYSAQLPQIMRLSGISRFLTQKLSWSLVNKFPHHTFWWEGIDGSRVLAHFPPGDNYCMEGRVEELLKTVNNFEDKGRSSHSAYLFGYGDGGGGPSSEMIELLHRVKDVDGLPKVSMSSPDEFFSAVEQTDTGNLCRWIGELYLELHNGTYTSQAKVKQNNRKCEFLLHDVEAVSTFASSLSYPTEELHRLWKLLLLNQFHDVLPGSSIGMVYEDAHKYYTDIEKSGKRLLAKAVTSIMSHGSSLKDLSTNTVTFNTLGWARSEVIVLPNQISSPNAKRVKVDDTQQQIDHAGNHLLRVRVPAYGYALHENVGISYPATIEMQGAKVILKNEHLMAIIDELGRVTSLVLRTTGREAIQSNGFANQFAIYDDIPLYWDAWDIMDYHLETRKPLLDVKQHAVILDSCPLRVSVQFKVKISEQSSISQIISLDADCPYLRFETEVSWHENRKLLKVEFPTDVRASRVTYEIQFGHIQRPNHFNTSWDWARFEVCGHKWADISEHGFGVSVLNDCKYGWSALDNVLNLSLLKAAKVPDDKADMMTHHFTYAIMPHAGSFQDSGVIQQAYNLNCPLVVSQLATSAQLPTQMSYFSVDTNQVVLETIKKCEHDKGVVLHLYEAFGGRATATVTTTLHFRRALRCNNLEQLFPEDQNVTIENNKITLMLTPFQIMCIKLEY